MIALRPYQVRGIDRVRASMRSGKSRVLFVLPTGGGKTVVAAHIIASAIALGSRVLFVAHRRELIKQAFCKLIRNGIPAEQIGIIMAGIPTGSAHLFAVSPETDDELWRDLARRRPTAPIQIASVDTFRNRAKPVADVVIVDEAHRALAASYRALLSEYPNAAHLGLTATPYRADGKGLGEVYEDLVVIASPRELIAEGFLVEPRVFTVPAKDMPDLSKVKMKGGDYDEEALAAAVDQHGLVGNIVEHWGKHARGVRTVVFATSVAHSQHIRDRFRSAGIACEHLDGMTETKERDGILLRLERGETTVVTNCGVLCEGWDMPSVKVCVLARPTKSTGLYLQQAGRILRPYIDTETGEAVRALILDHSGCAIEHGLPQDDREYSLNAVRKRKNAPVVTSTRTCEECYAVLPVSTRVCPECGFVFGGGSEGSEGVPEEDDGELVEIKTATQEEKHSYWLKLCQKAADRGYKPGWAKYKYREKFHAWPPNSFGVPKIERRPWSEDEKRQELFTLVRIGTERGYDPNWALIRYQAKFGETAPAEIVREARKPQEVVPWAV